MSVQDLTISNNFHGYSHKSAAAEAVTNIYLCRCSSWSKSHRHDGAGGQPGAAGTAEDDPLTTLHLPQGLINPHLILLPKGGNVELIREWTMRNVHCGSHKLGRVRQGQKKNIWVKKGMQFDPASVNSKIRCHFLTFLHLNRKKNPVMSIENLDSNVYSTNRKK